MADEQKGSRGARLFGISSAELDGLREELKSELSSLEARLRLDVETLRVEVIDFRRDVTGRLERYEANVLKTFPSQLLELQAKMQELDTLDEQRVNGVHGRLDVTRAEFAEAIARLTERMGEDLHRTGLLTVEVQRASEVFDLKLSAIEIRADQLLRAASAPPRPGSEENRAGPSAEPQAN